MELQSQYLKRKQEILDILEAKEENWNDWHWQLRNRVKNVENLCRFFKLTENEIEGIKSVSEVYRWAISPYYMSLIDPNDKFDPIRLLAVPCKLELQEFNESLDPMAEEYTNPSGAITRRYPDRLIINVTNECAMYCRHCQRRRNIGSKDRTTSKSKISESINYIRDNEEIRDVLITGGDPLTL